MTLVLERNTPPANLLGPSAWSRRLRSSETLFLEGDAPTSLYQVREGFLKLTWSTPGGRECISELLLPGDVFDLPSCIDGAPYPFSCKTLSHSAALLSVVSRGALLEDPELGLRCQARLVQQLRQQRSHPLATVERVEVRITRALLWLASGARERVASGLTFPFPVTRQELAEWVGTTTETVIRVCSQLRRRGLVSFQRGSVTLLRLSELLRLCQAA